MNNCGDEKIELCKSEVCSVNSLNRCITNNFFKKKRNWKMVGGLKQFACRGSEIRGHANTDI